MKRYDFTEAEWHKYEPIIGWLTEHYGQSEHWEQTLFEPRRTKPDVNWYYGTHRTKWYRRTGQRLCVWMPDDVYTMFMLRFA